MKATKIAYLLVAALALTIVGTGCQKRPTGITPIKDRTTMIRTGEDMNNLPPIGDGTGVVGTEIGGGAQSTTFANPDDFNQDRSTFAANTVHFEYDSSVVKSSEQGNLDAVATYMKANSSVGLLVEGHCDERGTEDYNNSLGERRATALREALINLGVDAGHVVTRSYGEYKPVAPGQDESSYRQNRRGEFVVLLPK